MIKYPEESKERKEIFNLSGKDIGKKAKKLGELAVCEYVYWEGETIRYNSIKHRDLLRMFIQEKFYQNKKAMNALVSTADQYRLNHDVGPENPNTSLPKNVFLETLIEIRNCNKKFTFLEEQNTSNQEFRFNGPAPQGKFEYTCYCGQQEFNRNIFGGNIETYRCIKCGAEFTIKDQGTHWHLNITRRQI